MKKVSFLFVVVIFATKSYAQKTQSSPAQKATSPVAATAAKKNSGISIPANSTQKVAGLMDAGVVLVNEKGEKSVLTAKNEILPLEKVAGKSSIKPIASQVDALKLIGTTNDGTPVWQNTAGKNSTINTQTASRNDYVGHVTLLR